MRVSMAVFSAIWLVIILPLVFLNKKGYTKKREGEPARPNWPRIMIVAACAVLVSLFMLSLFNFTIGYEPQLALERALAQALEKTEPPAALQEAMAALNGEEGKLAAQFGEKISARLAAENMPGGADIRPGDKQTIYMGFRLATQNEPTRYELMLARLHLEDNVWQIESFYLEDGEMESFLIKNKLLYELHVSPWRNL